MDQETKITLSKLQQAVWKLSEAKVLLESVDSSIAEDIIPMFEALQLEMDELHSIDN